jgi:misacylated tRNA(Ala) deacylase
MGVFMEKALYMDDSYLKEFPATVESVKDDKFVVLDQTVFYPNGGGQPTDTGAIIKDNEEFPVVYVGRFDGKISHEISRPGLKVGDKVVGRIDWGRRYKLMRMHTAAHLLSSVFHNRMGALITGNQKDVDKTRMDFNLENFDRAKVDEMIKTANDIIEKDLPVKAYYKSRDDAMKIPGIVKLANALPPNIEILRIVEIENVDIQADGGTHVKSLKEIGKIDLLKVENKGKSNRRVYFGVN